MKRTTFKLVAGLVITMLLIAMLSVSAFAAEKDRTGYRQYDHSYDDIIADAMRARETEYIDDKYGLSMSDFAMRISYVYFTNSDIIGIKDISTFYLLQSGAPTSFRVDFVDDFDAYVQRLQQVRAEVDALMPENPSELEIVHILHDYLVSTSAFDMEAGNGNVTDYSVFYASGVYKNHSAVCRGISHAYKYLLDCYGIDNAIAESTNYNHVWNLVRLNGEWYHVDITADEEGGYDVLGKVSHDYFLISTETLLSRNALKSDFEVLYKNLDLVFTDSTCATDKTYESNQPWSDSHSVCHYYNGDMYYIGADSVLYKNGEYFFQPAEHMSWHPFGNQYAIYTGASVSAKLTAIGKDLYMNSPRNIYHVDLDTGKAEIVYSPEAVQPIADPFTDDTYPNPNQIFGLNRMEGKMYISIEEDLPDDEETWVYVPGFDVTYEIKEPEVPSGLIDPKDKNLKDTVAVAADMGQEVNVSFSGLQEGETLSVTSGNAEVATASVSGSRITVKTGMNGTAAIKVMKMLGNAPKGSYTINVTVNKNYTNSKTLTMFEGGSVTVTDESGDYSGAVNKTLLDAAIANVKITGVNIPATPGTPGGFSKISTYANGSYIIGYESGSSKYYLKASGSSLSVVTDKSQATSFAFSGTASSFTIKSGSYYLTHGSKLALSTSTSNSAWCFDSGKIYYSKTSLSRTYKYYLRYSGSSFTASNSSSSLAGAYSNQEATPEIPGELYTKVEVTGLSAGKTYVIVGDTLYIIVVERELGTQEITVHTVDDMGVKLAEDYVISGKEGDTYNVQPTFRYGYLAPSSIFGTFTSAPTGEVSLVYTLNTDKTDLYAAITNVVSGDQYSAASYKAYENAVAAGRDIYNKTRATQVEVDDAVEAISKAKNALAKVTYTITINYVDNFGTKVAATETKSGELGEGYTVTPKAISGYIAPAAVSGTFFENTTITLVYTLNTDKSALVSELGNVIAADLYTSASYATYSTAIENGKSVNSNAQATQAQVDAAVKAITDAKAKLTKKTFTITVAYTDDAGVKIADNTTISGEINSAYTITPKAIAGYAAPNAVSGTFSGNTTVTLVYTLTTDKSKLVSELNNVIAKGEYTDDSYAVYTAAIESGKSVNSNTRATQAQVDAAVKAITDAKAALKVVSKVAFVKDTDGINSGAEYVLTYNGKALAVSNGSITYVSVTETDGGIGAVDDSAVWVLTKYGSSTYYLQNKATGQYLTTTTSGSIFSRTYSLGLTTSKTTWTATKNGNYMRLAKSSRYITYSNGFGLTTSKTSNTDLTLYVKK